MMNKARRIAYILSAAVALTGALGYITVKYRTDSASMVGRESVRPSESPNAIPDESIPMTRDSLKRSPGHNANTSAPESDTTVIRHREDEQGLNPDTSSPVDRIKKQIYGINVEYVEDISLLDDIIQESAAEPQKLWHGEWVSVDDWKRYDDLFTVEKDESGVFKLVPGQDGAQAYHYDEKTKEFVWELDYYGKTITHKARFISDNVMVLMKISGIKVALDIYTRTPQ